MSNDFDEAIKILKEFTETKQPVAMITRLIGNLCESYSLDKILKNPYLKENFRISSRNNNNLIFKIGPYSNEYYNVNFKRREPEVSLEEFHGAKFNAKIKILSFAIITNKLDLASKVGNFIKDI